MENLFGRTQIFTNVDEITRDNVIEVLSAATNVHSENVSQIEYLWNYYKGKQPILERVKEIRPEINNMIVENRAKEIVDFKVGYLVGEPIQYVGRGEADTAVVNALNDMMMMRDKEPQDEDLATWQMICGTGFRGAFPEQDPDEIPFKAYSIDPRQAFVIYSSDISKRPMAGCYMVVDEEGETHYTVYTPDVVYHILNQETIESIEPNMVGRIPIVEYPANSARLGAFEPVLTMLDAINTVDSNRVDGIEQFIQSLIVCINCEFPEGTTAGNIMQAGLVKLRSVDGMTQDIKILSEQLNQDQTEIVKSDMYQAVLTICMMPNRNGGSSTSDTGIAVIYRDGWEAAESSAKKQEMLWKKSEREFLRIVQRICEATTGPNFRASEIDIKFTRRNYENIQSKAQVLTSMLDNERIDPKLAFIYSNMFPDPEEAYKMSLPYIEKANAAEAQSAQTDASADAIDGREA